MTNRDDDPLNDPRWRTALYILAVIGSIDLVQLIVLIVVLLER